MLLKGVCTLTLLEIAVPSPLPHQLPLSSHQTLHAPASAFHAWPSRPQCSVPNLPLSCTPSLSCRSARLDTHAT